MSVGVSLPPDLTPSRTPPPWGHTPYNGEGTEITVFNYRPVRIMITIGSPSSKDVRNSCKVCVSIMVTRTTGGAGVPPMVSQLAQRVSFKKHIVT